MPAHFLQGEHEPLAVDAELLQDASRRTLVVGDGQQQVLDRDIVIRQALGLVLGLQQRAIQTRADVDLLRLAGRPADARQFLQFAMYAQLERVHGDLRLGENGGRQSLFLVQQAEQKVFDIHLLMAEANGKLLRPSQCFLGLLSKMVQIHCVSLLSLSCELRATGRGAVGRHGFRSRRNP